MITYKYKDDAVLIEYRITYLDNKSDYKMFDYIPAYSSRQAIYKFKKKHDDPTLRIADVEEWKEIPNNDGKQLEMDFGEA